MDFLTTGFNKNQALRVHGRKLLLKRKGFRYADFGDPSLVRRVIYEEQPNPRIRRDIARRLKLAYRTVWPV